MRTKVEPYSFKYSFLKGKYQGLMDEQQIVYLEPVSILFLALLSRTLKITLPSYSVLLFFLMGLVALTETYE